MKNMSKEEILIQINKALNMLDDFVKNGDISRIELTKIVLKRHILSAKHVYGYILKNMGKLF